MTHPYIPPNATGRVHGKAGGSADSFGGKGSTWALGARGERLTAADLDALAAADPHLHVFHDLRMPGLKANIDHLLIRGSKVLILDTKFYKAGFYWTGPGGTWRGLSREPSLDKQGSQMYLDRIRKVAKTHGLPASSVSATLVFRPGGKGMITCWALRPKNGVRAIGHTALSREVRKRLGTAQVKDNGALLAWAGSLVGRS